MVFEGNFMVDGSFALFAVTACKLKIKDCDEGPTDQTVGFFESEVYESTNCFPTSVLLQRNGIVLELKIACEF